MISRVYLQNFRSVGTRQEAPLEAITVLVGANNSGKSNFLGFVKLVRDGVPLQVCVHRPPLRSGAFTLGWQVDLSARGGEPHIGKWELNATADGQAWRETVIVGTKEILVNDRHSPSHGVHLVFEGMGMGMAANPVVAPHFYRQIIGQPQRQSDLTPVLGPVMEARDVHLKVDQMRALNRLEPNPQLAPDGSNLSALIAHWELERPEILQRFNRIMSDCLPELERVAVTCPTGGQVALNFRQRDGQTFGLNDVSDGVLVFAGLIAHALCAAPNSLMLMEEPERGIHPRRLSELVDLLRTLVQERGTQFIMATHSPAMLNVFRDEPEAILLFRRTAEGTAISPLSASPTLVEALERSDPGAMLAEGVFNEDIGNAPERRDSE